MKLRFGLAFALWGFIGLQACASQGVMLVHPSSGSTIKCGAAGVGSMAGGVAGYVSDCLNHYERLGYVQVDKLTPEQRADLEQRGILPKTEAPSPRGGTY